MISKGKKGLKIEAGGGLCVCVCGISSLRVTEPSFILHVWSPDAYSVPWALWDTSGFLALKECSIGGGLEPQLGELGDRHIGK
jgi:hypothetical protein